MGHVEGSQHDLLWWRHVVKQSDLNTTASNSFCNKGQCYIIPGLPAQGHVLHLAPVPNTLTQLVPEGNCCKLADKMTEAFKAMAEPRPLADYSLCL